VVDRVQTAADSPSAVDVEMPTSLDALDEGIGGLQSGDLVFLTEVPDNPDAAPGQGRTCHGLDHQQRHFVGVDDDAWWSIRREPDDALAGFFVAFTRAKQGVVFAYCGARGERRNIAPL